MRTQSDDRHITRGMEAADTAKLSTVRPCNIVSHAAPAFASHSRLTCPEPPRGVTGHRILIDTHVEQETCLTPYESATSPKFDRYTFAPFCPAFRHTMVMISFPAMPCNIRYIAHRPLQSRDTPALQTLQISQHPCREILRVSPISSTKRPKSLGTFSCHAGPGNLPVGVLANGRLTRKHAVTPVSEYLKFGGGGRKFGELTWPAAGSGSGGPGRYPGANFPALSLSFRRLPDSYAGGALHLPK